MPPRRTASARSAEHGGRRRAQQVGVVIVPGQLAVRRSPPRGVLPLGAGQRIVRLRAQHFTGTLGRLDGSALAQLPAPLVGVLSAPLEQLPVVLGHVAGDEVRVAS